MKTRTAAVAGRFYPKNKFDLADKIKDLQKSEKENIDYSLAQKTIIGGIVPHAGYQFSGYEAVHVFEIIKKSGQQFDTIVILSPNHTGYGLPISLDNSDYWQTPLGAVPIDAEFQELLPFGFATEAHKFEHSAEVILPFLQMSLTNKYKIVPISILQQNLTNARNIAAAIYQVSHTLNRKILVLASSDFSHFVSPKEGIQQDDFAVKHILKLDSVNLESVVKKKRISICGYGPIMILMEYAGIAVEGPNIKMLARGNSAKGYPSVEVVDYISFLAHA